MLKVNVLYRHPQDPAAFDKYFHETHLPIALKMKNLRGFTVGKCVSPDPAEKPPYYQIVSIYVDSLEAFQQIISSPEGQAAVADMQNYATGGADMMLDEEEILMPVSLS